MFKVTQNALHIALYQFQITPKKEVSNFWYLASPYVQNWEKKKMTSYDGLLDIASQLEQPIMSNSS